MPSVAMIWLVLGVLIAKSWAADDDAPKPLEILPSQWFEGIDGPWSTFDLVLGTPNQYLRVLVSTASPESIIPLSEYACSTAVFGDAVPNNCAKARGNLFNPNTSSSWIDMGQFFINDVDNGVGLEANLGYRQKAQWGLEKVQIGLTNGPSLENQTVAGIATASPFYMGIFGLNNQPVNFTILGNLSQSSFLTTLKDQKKIPSLSWSYTAGANYQLKGAYGQLIFSGYDTSRFRENSVSFTMADDITRDLVVALQSISYSGSTSAVLLSEPIDIFIDSTDPNLWLPSDACDAFEQAFGLTLDSETGLYLVNETHHQALKDSNAEVTFRLSDIKSGGEEVAIVLPYRAFDLEALPPFVKTKSRYFPLKRAANSTQYTLGRTFLQEAYLSADYERKVFNVSACVWNEGAKQNIVAITSTDSPADGGSSPADPSHKSSSLSGGTIAGIVVGAVVGAILLGLVIAFIFLRKRRKWMKRGFAIAAPKHRSDEPDVSMLNGPVFNSMQRSSTAEGSTPMSGADLFAVPSSTIDSSHPSHSRGPSSNPSPGMPIGAGISENTTGERSASAPAEVDGHDTAIKPSTELDGTEIRPHAKNDGVYELPGTAVAGPGNRPMPDRNISTVGELPSFGGPRGSVQQYYGGGPAGSDSPPSPLVSAVGSEISNPGAREDGSEQLVSPSSPTRNSTARPF
ncbi:aspartic peptidase domain-containing protein [Apodospora peruviana]|uniref:Aspartic peptidase domain-containing protein n=1 Tax=Apodospora peruviana TaxID=516989 RepID=A0AAE0IJF7_9PEZI|nr:aspartic peptidase domain-containing protein [Apodospora peruviana]